jgi:hypothetical protein
MHKDLLADEGAVGVSWNVIVGLVLVAAGAWAAWIRINRRRTAMAMAAWQQVQGRVLSHDIEESSSTDSSGDTSWHYDPKLAYEYEVAGTKRTGSRLSADRISFGSRKKAQAWLDQRPLGGPVTVYVNPDDHDETTLSPKATGDWWVPVFFVMLGLAVMAGLFG